MSSPSGAPVPARRVAGAIDRDEVWAGLVEIAGDVVIRPGATLTVAPGTSVRFLHGPCGIVVQGRLRVEGERDHPSTFGGPESWSGIYARDGGAVSIRDCRITGPSLCALDLEGGRHELQGVAVEGAQAGLVLRAAEAAARDLSLSGCREAVTLHEGSRLELEGGSVTEAGTGMIVLGAEADLRDVRFQGTSATALRARGGCVRVRDCRFTGPSACALDLEGGRHELERVEVEGARVGLVLKGGTASVRGLTCRDASGVGVSLQEGGRIRISGASFPMADAAFLALTGRSRAVIRNVTASSRTTNITVGPQGRLDMADCRLEASERPNIECRGGILKLGRSTLRGGTPMLLVRDGRVRIRDCRFTGPSLCALDLEGGRHELRDVVVDAAQAGLVLRAAEAAALGLSLSGCREAVTLHEGSRLELDGGSVTEAGMGFIALGAEAELRGVRFEGVCATALRARGGGVRVLDCRFTGPSACALDLEGGRHELRDVVVDAARAGLVLKESTVSASGLSLAGCREAVSLREESRLELEGCSIRGGVTGIVIRQAEASVRDLTCRDASEIGLSLQEGGRVRLRACRFGRSRVGLLLDGGQGRFDALHVDECSYMGAYVPSGTHRFTDYSGPSLILEAPAHVEMDGKRLASPSPEQSRVPPRLLTFVLATKEFRVFRWLYRAVYALGGSVVRRRIQADANVLSCGAWRGWRRGDCDPGVSDLDLVVVARGLSGRDGARWLAGFWERHRRWRRLFPFLGETLVAEETDVRDYLAYGGVRAPELPAHRNGRPAPVLSGTRRFVGMWTECAYSYARMIEWQWHRRDEPWERRRAQIFKCALDALRHLPAGRAARAEGAVASRKAFWDGLKTTPFAQARNMLRPLLEADDPDLPREVLLAELGAYVLRQMHGAGAEAEEFVRGAGGRPQDLRFAPVPEGKKGPLSEALPGRWASRVRGCRHHFGEALRGGLFDDLYPSYLFLDDGAAEGLGLGEILESYAREPHPMTIFLSGRLRPLWSSLAFLEEPTSSMGPGTAGAGRWVPERYRYAWGEVPASSPPAPLLLESSAQSWAHFKLIWRWLGSPEARGSGRFTRHYLLSRALGLRLLVERRLAAPFFDLDHLAGIYRSEFPEAARGLEAILPEGGLRAGHEVFGACCEFIDAQLREARLP